MRVDLPCRFNADVAVLADDTRAQGRTPQDLLVNKRHSEELKIQAAIGASVSKCSKAIQHDADLEEYAVHFDLGRASVICTVFGMANALDIWRLLFVCAHLTYLLQLLDVDGMALVLTKRP